MLLKLAAIGVIAPAVAALLVMYSCSSEVQSKDIYQTLEAALTSTELEGHVLTWVLPATGYASCFSPTYELRRAQSRHADSVKVLVLHEPGQRATVNRILRRHRISSDIHEIDETVIGRLPSPLAPAILYTINGRHIASWEYESEAPPEVIQALLVSDTRH